MRRVGGRAVPEYQLHLGGGVSAEGAVFGAQVVKIPAKRVPAAVVRLLEDFYANRPEGQSFGAYLRALDHPRARRILELCAAEVQATVVYPDSAAPAALDAALTVLASVPALGVLARALSERRDRVSVTVPTPLGTVIVLSAHAVSTPETTLAVGAHELAHAYQIQARGGWGTAVDYLGSAELRARGVAIEVAA